MPGRNAQVARFFALIDLLEKNPAGLTVTELWDKLRDRGHDSSKRTIYRDLQGIEQAGIPLFQEGEGSDQNAQRWRMERLTKINQYLVLSARELFALHLARGVLTPLRETPFFNDLEKVFEKIEEKLGSQAVQYVNELREEFRFEPGPKWGLGLDPEVLETVRSACAEGQLVEFTYNSVNSGTKRTRKVGPHYLYFSKGSLYLVAEDLEDQKVKAFALPRISHALLLDTAYEGLVTDPAEFFQGSFGIYRQGEPTRVSIRISNKLAAFVSERSWHPSQRVVHRKDGSVDLSLDVAITPELVQWVLGMASEAEVMVPLELRDAVTEEVRKLSSKYAKAA